MKKQNESKGILDLKKFQIAKIKNPQKIFGGDRGLSPTTGFGDDDSNSNTQQSSH